MKIGLVCPYNIFKGGGVQECVLALQAGLKKRGHTVKIITPLPRDNQPEPLEDVIFIGTARDVRSPFHTTAQVSVALDNNEIDALLLKENFDILHFHEPWVPIMSRQLLSRSVSKNVATFHAKLPETVMAKTIERVVTPYTRSVLKYLDNLTAVSPAAAEYVSTLTRQNVDIVPNGIDLAKYTQPIIKAPSKTKTIFYIGRLEKRKGLDYLIKAFQVLSLNHPGIRLVIGGDGPDREKLEQFIKSRGVTGIAFRGFMSEAEKIRALKHADLFCSPALYGESFGIVLLEAMASGCVTVAGDNPGYASVMKDVGEISLVNPKNVEEFCHKLELLLYNEALRSTWQGWAKQYIKQFDYPVIVKKYEDIYKQAVKA